MLDNNQLNTCEIQGQLFVLASRRGFKCSEFIRLYMRSEVAQRIDMMDEDPYTYSHEPQHTPGARLDKTAEELMEELLQEEKIHKAKAPGELYDEKIMYWTGWLYRYWHYHDHCRASDKIWHMAKGQLMKACYEELHEEKPEDAIDEIVRRSMADLWYTKK